MSGKDKSGSKSPPVRAAGNKMDPRDREKQDVAGKAGEGSGPARPFVSGATKNPQAPSTRSPAAKPGAAAPGKTKPAAGGPSPRPSSAAKSGASAKSPAAKAPPASAVTAPGGRESTGKEPAAPQKTVEPKPSAPPVAAKPKAEPRPLPPLCDAGDVAAVVAADHPDPFGFLGMHDLAPGGPLVVRALLPQAVRVWVVESAAKRVVAELARFDEAGLFAGVVEGRKERFPYRLAVETAAGTSEIEDPYRFPPVLSKADVQRLAEGNHPTSYEKLGSHPANLDGVDGVAFAVWAPHARRVAVIGEFNDWDGRRHGMRLRNDCGVWEIFLPGVEPGQLYKYEIKSSEGERLPDKSDPYAFFAERSPGSASVVFDLGAYKWGDRKWMSARKSLDIREAPVSIYEVHPGSWRRKPEEDNRRLTYRELADELVDYVKYMGFTHMELPAGLRVRFRRIVGYQPYAPYAPTSRWGTPDDFRLFVDRCHQAGIGVIADWVRIHFSDGSERAEQLMERRCTSIRSTATAPSRLNTRSRTITAAARWRTTCSATRCSGWTGIISTGCASMPSVTMLYLDTTDGYGASGLPTATGATRTPRRSISWRDFNRWCPSRTTPARSPSPRRTRLAQGVLAHGPGRPRFRLQMERHPDPGNPPVHVERIPSIENTTTTN